jgi:hypothetical protein
LNPFFCKHVFSCVCGKKKQNFFLQSCSLVTVTSAGSFLFFFFSVSLVNVCLQQRVGGVWGVIFSRKTCSRHFGAPKFPDPDLTRARGLASNEAKARGIQKKKKKKI